jgi:quercetin dioxygenase-like cupin family protein
MQELNYHTPDMKWKPAPEFLGDVEVKVLREDEERGARTILVHLPPGSRLVPHAHLGTVQHFVLEGEYRSNGNVYKADTYRFLPRHDDVSEITTEPGATILMIYDPVSN